MAIRQQRRYTTENKAILFLWLSPSQAFDYRLIIELHIIWSSIPHNILLFNVVLHFFSLLLLSQQNEFFSCSLRFYFLLMFVRSFFFCHSTPFALCLLVSIILYYFICVPCFLSISQSWNENILGNTIFSNYKCDWHK